jgi:hypothetical protein
MMNFSADADIANVRKRLARLYRNQQCMRFGMDKGWAQYFETPMRRTAVRFYCCTELGDGAQRLITVFPRYSGMQEMKL